jgi:hypothetical protein
MIRECNLDMILRTKPQLLNDWNILNQKIWRTFDERNGENHLPEIAVSEREKK